MKTIYDSHVEKSDELAEEYNRTNHNLYRYLAYRDIPPLIVKHAAGTNALDYGSGTGVSTAFLLKQGMIVTGVDVSPNMLVQAQRNCPNTKFHLIEEGIIPTPSNSFDLVFSSFVLFELGTEDEVINYLKEAKRVVKDNGLFIGVTGSQDMYSKDWFIFRTDYSENKTLHSGDKAKLFIPEANIEFTDTYWTERDYHCFFEKAGLSLINIHYPLGKEDEPYPWKDEVKFSPFVIFLAKFVLP